MPKFRPLLTGLALSLCCTLATPSGAQVRAPVTNTASLTYSAADGDRTVLSNTVSLEPVAAPIKLPTAVSFRQLPDNFSYVGRKCITTPTVTNILAQVSEAQLASARPIVSHDHRDAVLVVLTANGENRDPLVRETITIVAADGLNAVNLVLTETGANTGVFSGATPALNQFPDSPCDIHTARNDADIVLNFSETQFSYRSTGSLPVDPTGYVFDSRTGEPLSGVTVTVIDEATGLPAANVFAEDGDAYPNTVVTGTSAVDSNGDALVFAPGNFRFPLLAAGRYRLKITPPPSYTAPSLASRAAVSALVGPQGRYSINDASYGAAFGLITPGPVFIDVPIDGAPNTSGTLIVEKTASVREASPGDFVQYRLDVRNVGTVAAGPVSITDTLPFGLRYRIGSTRGAPEPQMSGDGRTASFSIAGLSSNTMVFLTYIVEITPGAPVGEAVNRATAIAPGFARSNEASAPVRLKPLLFTDGLTLIGRVTEGNCREPSRQRKGVPGIRLLMEDGSYVLTDRDGLYHFEGVRPGTHIVQLDTASVPGNLEPVQCDRDTRAAGSATSRFIEASGGSLQRGDFRLRPNGQAAVTADALPIVAIADALAAGNRDDWLTSATAGIDWLFPKVDYNPRAPAARVVIKHGVGQRVALRLNGEPVDALRFDGTDEDKTRGVAISTWTGLPLRDRDNVLDATVLDAQGATVTKLTRTVHYANLPASAVFDAKNSRLIADGLTRPLLAVRVTDREGRPVRAGSLIPYRVESPYLAASEAAAQQGRQLAGLDRTETLARVVGDDGIAFIALQPTRQAGAVHASITLAQDGVSRANSIEAWLSAPATKWVVVGFGKGTIGYNTLSHATPLTGSHTVVTDGQLAVYAKGRIKGSWLLTMAYDSDRRGDRDRGLLGVIDPDRYYTVYGDGSQQGYDAPTQQKLYLRIERRDFYALYGDFETGFTQTKLTRYNRTMNGAKAELQTRAVHVTAFAANDAQLYARDELQGNGLSGPYRLRASNIVPNSDKIRLETRDRFRSEKIIASVDLTRHIDYDIDVLAGTIRFREPILSRDAALNPNFIVVDYETESGSRKLAAGGRAPLKFGTSEIGASVLRDESVGRATVAGVDAKVKIGTKTELRAEAASGGRGGVSAGKAYLAEVEHHGGKIDGLAYFHRQSQDFGLGQQNFGEAGTQKIGLDGRLRLTDRISVTASGWVQDDLIGIAHRAAAEARVEYRRDHGTVFAGLQFAEDRGQDGTTGQSKLLAIGGTQTLFGDKLELTGQVQLAPGGDRASVDFPVRQHIGAKWRISKLIRLLADYEIANGNDFTARNARAGVDLSPWAGAHLLTTLNQGAIGENGTRTYAQYGLSQSLPLGKRWTLDTTVDSSKTVGGAIPVGGIVNPFHPVASGGATQQNGLDGDFTALTWGATYRGNLWSWNGRFQYRTSEREERWGITSNLLRTLGEGGTLASSIRAYHVREADGSTVSSATADIALALRPLDSRWSLLERFQLRHEHADAGVSSSNMLAVPTFALGTQATSRAVNNLAVNYRTGSEGDGHGIEASVYYGAKYVRGRFADETYVGFTDVIGAEVRKDLGRRFDLGGNVSMQHSWTSGTKAFSIGPSLGLSPAGNVWFTAGFNVKGFRDRDLQDGRWTQQGPYLTLRVRVDQQMLASVGRLFGKDMK